MFLRLPGIEALNYWLIEAPAKVTSKQRPGQLLSEGDDSRDITIKRLQAQLAEMAQIMIDNRLMKLLLGISESMAKHSSESYNGGYMSPETDKDTGGDQEVEENKETKMAKQISRKRRILAIGYMLSEHSLEAEEVVNNVDLLTEILLCLPAKSLLRLKSVSKHWLSLISDPQFAFNHTRRNPNSLISGLYVYYKPWVTNERRSISLNGDSKCPTLAFLHRFGEGMTDKLVSSCNGLFLCSNDRKMRYLACNLTTQKCTALPEPRSRSHRSRYHFGAYLAFDPSKSPHYKVVLVSYDDSYLVSPGTFYDIDIYPSKTASWKHMRLTAPPGVSYLRRVFWNGAIHWMSQENIHIRFDVDAENLMGTALPSIPRILSEKQIRYFGECGGDLLLIQTRMCHAMKFRILTMDKDCSRWNVKYWVNLKPVISGILGITSSFFSVLSVVNGANGKDLVLVLAVTGNFVLYNVDCKTLKALPELQPDESHEPGEMTKNLEAYEDVIIGYTAYLPKQLNVSVNLEEFWGVSYYFDENIGTLGFH
ncbi:hypothetical protein Acr_01g0007150 [Actinidia rufa]|uniref:F-box domain-containing protein n=1 Tax=Actinidia rufa TaxID=165716 RepID=A0A7J0E423_9ERIC|nr:hypothetical protein Acr_01g0007150 [Actinidia rufa]